LKRVNHDITTAIKSKNRAEKGALYLIYLYR